MEVTNRFKELDLIDTVPEELWTEVHDIVQEAVIKIIPQKRNVKRQMRKGKIYPSECRVSRIARRDKKVFLSDQCKEIEEKNRMRKTRDLFKKTKDTKEAFHAMMGTTKDSKELTEAEEIKRRWQEHTEL